MSPSIVHLGGVNPSGLTPREDVSVAIFVARMGIW